MATTKAKTTAKSKSIPKAKPEVTLEVKEEDVEIIQDTTLIDEEDNKDVIENVNEEDMSIAKSDVDLETLLKEKEEQDAKIATLLEKMEQMSQAIATQSQPNIQIVKNFDDNKKVKVVSCKTNYLNLCTEPRGGGSIYRFPTYGSENYIRMSQLEKCVNVCRNCFVKGYVYICDMEAVADLGLMDVYDSIYNAEELNDIIRLKNGAIDVEKICNMGVYDKYSGKIIDTSMRDTAIESIVANMVNGVSYDRNLIFDINSRLGIDIDERVKGQIETKKRMEESNNK